MSSYLWISVIVKCGCIIVIPRKVLQCSFVDTFGDIVHKLQLTSTVEKVSISNNAMFVDPNQCGASLFASDTSHSDTIVVREALVCSSCIETQYYSSVLVHFPPVCYYCGVPEEALHGE